MYKPIYQTIVLAPNFHIELLPSPQLPLPEELEQTVASIWAREKAAKGDRLFNGQILALSDLTPHRLQGRWVEYRQALAVYRQPALALPLALYPVSVNGLVQAGDKLLFGQRAHYLATYPGHMELVPSGGLDPSAARGSTVDFRQAILEEFEQETGLTHTLVQKVTPIMAMTNLLAPLTEICLRLEVDPSLPDQSTLVQGEYENFRWVDTAALDRFFAKEKVVPLSQAFVRYVQRETK